MDLPELLGKVNEKLLLNQISGLETRDFCEDVVFPIASMERGSVFRERLGEEGKRVGTQLGEEKGKRYLGKQRERKMT